MKININNSNKNFGKFLTVILTCIFIYCILFSNYVMVIITGVGGGLCLYVTLFRSNLLGPLNKSWHLIGRTLGYVCNPLILSILYFLFLTPIALILKARGHDPLRLNKRNNSYWIKKKHNGNYEINFYDQY